MRLIASRGSATSTINCLDRPSETLVAQAAAVVLVLGSYLFVNWRAGLSARGELSAVDEQIMRV